ncbi:MAG TPA: RNA methyltransferase [Bacteroidales bacterium]|nr:RNA methyltransferase [Bacteroidales bacterium]
MLSLSQKKYLSSLQQKKFQLQHGVFVVEGEKIVRELLGSDMEVQGLYALSDELAALGNATQRAKAVFEVSASDMDRISHLKTPGRILAVAKRPSIGQAPLPIGAQLTLMLDSIQDPGNMGTIVRTADWFGIREVICSPSTVDIFNPKVIQSTMGSFLRVKVYYTDLPSYCAKLSPEIDLIGASLDGSNMLESRISNKSIIVIGNESAGISPELNALIRKRISIPGSMHLRGVSGAESLNASVAAGILMMWATNGFSPTH